MQITVTIPDEFAAQVQARGLTPEFYVETLIAEQAGFAPVSVDRENKLADLELFFREIAAHSEKIPFLPDTAFTRENFYRDHD